VIYQTKILIRNNGKYLLLKKARDIHKDHINCWEVPGGKIKFGENPIEASLREIKEETGIDCKIVKELKFLNIEKDNIKTNTHVFLAETNKEDVKISDEHSDFIWVSYDEIDNLDNVIFKQLLKEYILEADGIN